ncbi:MAG: thioredoxin [Betaproteobacteria bacterium]|nr:thioredoxin [Betaproteobacteria bacterium]MSQ87792.1 thioredoxin [Betaproteobacteria bacterium]
MRIIALLLALATAAPASAQAPSPHALEIPSWFIETFLDMKEDVREAATQGKRVMLYFGQDGCPYCTALLQTNFSQRTIVDKTRRHFVAIALNLWGDREIAWIDGRRMTEKALGRELRVQFTPTLLFLDEQGAVALRLNGYLPPHRFEAALDYAAGLAGKGLRYDEYIKTTIREAASATLHKESFFAAPPVVLRGSKPVALLFETPYCAGCDELHREGLRRPEVRRLLERFDIYRLTLDDKRSPTTTWARELRVAYTPALVFFDRGKEVFRIDAYLRPFHLASALDYVASGAYRQEPSFQRYLQARAERLRDRGEKVDLWK